MPITDPLVLPNDVILSPVTDYSGEAQARMKGAEGEYSVTRPRTRARSSIIDSQSADLLNEFRSPKTIVQAVLDYSRARSLDPEQVLEKAFPMLKRFWSARVLVSAGSPDGQRIEPSTATGDRLGPFEIVSCLQVLEDSEVYRVRAEAGDAAVLKILRDSNSETVARRMLNREALILERLRGKIGPKLIRAGDIERRSFLLLEFCEGTTLEKAAQRLRSVKTRESRDALLLLCSSVLDSYSRLHAAGVIHGDVHPRNVIIAETGPPRVIDFGLARWLDVSRVPEKLDRGGIAYFFDPEYARAVLSHTEWPQSTLLSEQYSLAALMYLVLTGEHYLQFSFDKSDMLEQIVGQEPLPFSSRGAAPWQVEHVLARSLSKDPGERWQSVAEFASKLREAGHSQPAAPLGGSQAARAFLDDILARLRPSEALFQSGLRSAPICSVNVGAAGIAYTLYRIACQRGDPEVLSMADVWSSRAVSQVSSEEAFHNQQLGYTPEVVGNVSLYHTTSGVHLVQALISHAMNDVASLNTAVENFVAASRLPCDNFDLTLGRSGTLLGTALLLEALATVEVSAKRQLQDLANETITDIWDRINRFPPIHECREVEYLGLAHGWAGLLYALLRCREALGEKAPERAKERLTQLAACAEAVDHAVRWPWRSPPHPTDSEEVYMSGWCGGSAGMVHLWCLAHSLYRDAAYADLAERAACHCWSQPVTGGDLCCGAAGRAYALLHLYKHSGDKIWFERATELADLAVTAVQRSCLRANSLYKGEIGVALLIADLQSPESSCMPVFESEGWPRIAESRA